MGRWFSLSSKMQVGLVTMKVRNSLRMWKIPMEPKKCPGTWRMLGNPFLFPGPVKIINLTKKTNVKYIHMWWRYSVCSCVTFSKTPITSSNSSSEMTTGWEISGSFPFAFTLELKFVCWKSTKHLERSYLLLALLHCSCQATPCLARPCNTWSCQWCH